MTAWCVRLLRRLLAWLEGPEPPPPPPVVDPLDLATAAAVQRAAALVAVSGEYRRHWVFTRLVKQFPDRRKRDVGLAIERAVAARAESLATSPARQAR